MIKPGGLHFIFCKGLGSNWVLVCFESIEEMIIDPYRSWNAQSDRNGIFSSTSFIDTNNLALASYVLGLPKASGRSIEGEKLKAFKVRSWPNQSMWSRGRLLKIFNNTSRAIVPGQYEVCRCGRPTGKKKTKSNTMLVFVRFDFNPG